ncbi:MAG: hemolysin family protein, partial [Acidobacteria bacterium]|nr:hemolysin family protein [Acidobacteriota bacterium]
TSGPEASLRPPDHCMSPSILLPIASVPSAGGILSPGWGLLTGLMLVFVNGFFVAAEFALVKVRPTQLEPHVSAASGRGKIASHMVVHLDAYLSACQLGITLASLALGWIGEPAFAWIVEPLVRRLPGTTDATVHQASIAVSFMVITILHIVIGELAPKSIAIRKPVATSLWIAMPLWLFYKATYPAVWLLNHASNFLLRRIGIEPVTEQAGVSDEAELRRMLAAAGDDRLSAQKRELLDNVFELSDRCTRQVMVPRNEVVYLNTQQSLERNLQRARASGHTRFPLCDGGLDHVTGLVHIKDIFRAETLPTSLLEIRRDITFVPETLSLDRLLRRMRLAHVHMCAALDEYGGVSGIVTMENVVEEIVGDIQDEFDAEEPELVARGENVYDIAGSMLIADLEDELDLELSDRDEDTIAGVVLSELGREPHVGDKIEVGRLRAEIKELDGNRITLIRATLSLDDPSGETT